MLQIRSFVDAGRARLRRDIKYHHLDAHSNGGDHLRWGKPAVGRRKSCSPFHNRRLRFAVVSILLLLLLISFFSDPKPPPRRLHQDGRTEGYLHLLLPASAADANLCKTLVSAAIVGYPTPTLLNWNQTFDRPNLLFGGAHLAKISGVLGHLRNLTSEHDDDLVVIADGYDVWFQLRPSVLIERYFDINREADARLGRLVGARLMSTEAMFQKVVFSAQKRCWPREPTDPACWVVPPSTLPADIYGPKTDTHVPEENKPYAKFRPQFLNAGSIVGTVAAVRDVFQRAAAIAKKDKNIGSDQGIFAQIFGEQEFYRHHAAKRSRNVLRRLVDWFLKSTGREYSYSLIDPETRGGHQFVKLAEGVQYEYGIGLDYDSRLFQGTVFAEDDGAWVRFNDRTMIREVAEEGGASSSLRVDTLPTDITASLAPFSELDPSNTPDDTGVGESSWEEVPLFTNVWTGISPVAVHHSAHRNGSKRLLETHWNETWFQQHGRPLLNARLLAGQQPIAITMGSGAEHTWHSPAVRGEWGRLATNKGHLLRFDQLCASTWEEVFRDGDRDWVDPRAGTDQDPELWPEQEQPDNPDGEDDGVEHSPEEDGVEQALEEDETAEAEDQGSEEDGDPSAQDIEPS